MKSYRRWIRWLVGPSLLNGINYLSHLEDRLFDLEARRAQLAGVILQEHFRELFAKDPGAEFQIFLLELLNQTGAPTKRFVEIGIENARECNTAVLAFVLGWDGLMLEADRLGVAAARKLTARMLQGRPNYVEIRQALVTRENINALIKAEDLDVLSIDVDGMDFWLWKAFDRTQPRLVVM